MQKLTFLIYHQEYETFIDQLRNMGVVHIIEKQSGEMDEQLQSFITKEKNWTMLLENMSKWAGGEFSPLSGKASGDEIVAEYERLMVENHQLVAQQTSLKKDISLMEVWGDFDWTKIDALQQNGWILDFFACAEKDFQSEWVDEYNAVKIASIAAKCYFVTMTQEKIDIDAERIKLPKKSLSELKLALAEVEKTMDEKEKALRQYCKDNYRLLERNLAHLEGDMQLWKVKLSGDKMASGAVLLLEGWVPEENQKEIVEVLEKSSVYYEIRMATKEDDAPIKLKNNAFVRMYEALTKMYGMPDYGELDPTPLIAPFFTLFFGFCMGDAGYGFIMILLGFLLKRKMSAEYKGMMNLVITLGVATTIMGTILGTCFGVDLFHLNLPHWLKQFMIVGKIGHTSYDKQMLLALLIGVFQICIAMTVKAITSTIRFGFKESLSAWGWLILVLGFITTGGLRFFEVISNDVSTWAFIAIGSVAGIGIYLFNNIHRNVFINVGAGLWDTYNMVTGLLGDSLSYIRLYALGLAGAMLGGVFNDLGLMVFHGVDGGIIGWILCGVILILGHSLNIAMSCLSAFVHPLRLTFVEYFKNSGYEGKGKAYKPFTVVRDK